MKMLLTLFLFIFCSLSVAHADVGTLNSFTYRVYFPKNLNCDIELAKVSARFTEQTGLAVSSQSCVAIDSSNSIDPKFQVNAGVLVYQAAQEKIVNPVLFGEPEVYSESITSPLDYTGIYKSYADCLSDIPAQSKVFSSVTKTEPVSVYCVPAKAITETYVLHVDSFLSQKMRLFVFQAFQGTPSTVALNKVLQMISSDGTTLAKVSGNFIFFYDTSPSDLDWSPEHVHLKNIIAGVFEEGSQCQSQLLSVTNALQEGRVNSLVAVCTSSGAYNSPMIEITGDLLHVSLGAASNSYLSMEECLQDKQRALAEYTRTSGTAVVLGGFCSFFDVNEYRLQTIETF